MTKTAKAVASLGKFVRQMVGAGVHDKNSYRVWKKEHLADMEKFFWFKSEKGWPNINNLVNVFFHPRLPLVGLNYTHLAHNTLFAFPEAWTEPLRLCRGIFFDFEGNLVAISFKKFYNYGEHPETTRLPRGPIEATTKHDGHLGIIFEFRGELILSTRGDFCSASSVIGNQMLLEYSQKYDWKNIYHPNVCLLVEIIHPQTKVFLEYDGVEKFILIGATNRVTLEDYGYTILQALAKEFQLELTEIWSGRSLRELKNWMNDPTVKNREGFVVRFPSGLRVKFKFGTYIAMMVEGKLDYKYLMLRYVSGNLKKMLGVLEEEVYLSAKQMLQEILDIAGNGKSQKERWRELYALVAPEDRTSYFQSVCRQFIKYFDQKK